MAKRRSNGEGSFWQLPDRTWVHQITIGRKEDGSLQRKSFKGATKKICKQRKEEWLAEQERLKTELEQQNLEKNRWRSITRVSGITLYAVCLQIQS